MQLHERLYERQNKLVTELRERRDAMWCDIATEKIAKAYNVPCTLVGTWNYQQNVREQPAFYEAINTTLVTAPDEIGLFMFRPLEIDYYEPVRDLLADNGFERRDTLPGHGVRLYIYRRAAASD